MSRDRIPIDNPDDEIIPASPGRRRTATTIGCLAVVLLLAVLIWFGATHTETFEGQSLFGF